MYLFSLDYFPELNKLMFQRDKLKKITSRFPTDKKTRLVRKLKMLKRTITMHFLRKTAET